MSDSQLLLFVLVIFYLGECLIWVKSNSVLLFSFVGAKWLTKFPNDLYGNLKGGIWINNPLPPFGYTFICHLLPVTFSSNRLTNFVGNTLNNDYLRLTDSKSVPFNKIDSIRLESRKIIINDNFKIKARSYRQAKLLYSFILDNINVGEKERHHNIKLFIRNSLETKDVMKLWQEYRKWSIYLRISCNLTWLHIFVISPAAISIKGFLGSFYILLITYSFLHIATIIIFFISYRKIQQDFSKEELFINTFKMLFFPPAIIRSIDLLSVNLFDIYHPLAVIYILDPKKQFNFFARKLILDLKYPLPLNTDSEEILEINTWFKKQQLDIFKSFIKKRTNLEKLLLPDDSIENYKSYCPRCLMKYNLTSGKCSECGDIDLVPKN